MVFNEENLIEKSIGQLNSITIDEYTIEASSYLINTIDQNGKQETTGATESIKQKATPYPLDLVEELSKNTSLSYRALLKIAAGLSNYNEVIKSPLQYIQKAEVLIRKIELDEMLRGLEYHLTGEKYSNSSGKTEVDELFHNYALSIDKNRVIETPVKGVFDKMTADSEAERQFIIAAENNPAVICFLKFPSWYKIETPVGEYIPEFGAVMKTESQKSKNEIECCFVIEARKNNDKKRLKESDDYKIRCAMKHFAALGVNSLNLNYTNLKTN